jgi:hypothetical protein
MVYFQTKNPIWVILQGLEMEEVGTFYGNLIYFTDIWHNLWQFDLFYGHLA